MDGKILIVGRGGKWSTMELIKKIIAEQAKEGDKMKEEKKEAVEVVRCKNCANTRVVPFVGRYSVVRCPFSRMDVEPEGYCHHGVRRQEAQHGETV